MPSRNKYLITIVDGACTILDSITITEPTVLSAAIDATSKTDNVCKNGNDGTITVTDSSGGSVNSLYTYQLEDGSGILRQIHFLVFGQEHITVYCKR